MKKIRLITCFVFFVMVASAQSILLKSGPALSQKPKFDLKHLRANNNSYISKTSATLNSGWFNYGNSIQNLYGITSDLNCNYLFPDSMGFGEFGAGNFEPIWVHHLAEITDFKSTAYSASPSTDWVTNTTAFKIDSMSVSYAYKRNHPNPNIVDTLIITIFDNTDSLNICTTGLLNVSNIPGGADTISYKKIGYNNISNSIAMATNTNNAPFGQHITKVLLTIADTSLMFIKEKVFQLSTPFSSNGQHIVVADVQFKPGYSYQLGDHVDYTGNVFYFASLEENGAGSYPSFTDCNYSSNSCDYNSSQIVPKDIRYNNLPLYNGRFLPSYLYMAPFQFEHHLISFHLIDTIQTLCQVNALFSISVDSLFPGVYNAYENSTGNGALSYFWDFGDGFSTTQHYPSHQYAIPGQYVVCLTVTSTIGTNVCSNTYCDSSSVQKPEGFLMSQFNVIPQITTGTNTFELVPEIKAYPNPILDDLNIDVSGTGLRKFQYALIDALGRIIISASSDKTNVMIKSNHLEKGFYHLSILNDKGELVTRIKLIK